MTPDRASVFCADYGFEEWITRSVLSNRLSVCLASVSKSDDLAERIRGSAEHRIRTRNSQTGRRTGFARPAPPSPPGVRLRKTPNDVRRQRQTRNLLIRLQEIRNETGPRHRRRLQSLSPSVPLLVCPSVPLPRCSSVSLSPCLYRHLLRRSHMSIFCLYLSLVLTSFFFLFSFSLSPFLSPSPVLSLSFTYLFSFPPSRSLSVCLSACLLVYISVCLSVCLCSVYLNTNNEVQQLRTMWTDG